MRKKLFRSIVAQELAFFDNSRKGELLSRLSLDISTAQVGTLLPPTRTFVAPQRLLLDGLFFSDDKGGSACHPSLSFMYSLLVRMFVL
jgi:ABC-type transport system involved in cytochrome bd biosynthesis fused ATPase/permease subunit